MVLTRFFTHRYTSGRDSAAAATSNVVSSNATASCGSAYERVAAIKDAVVSLHEGRASTREAALSSIIAALEGFVLRRCCASIKKGAARESTLALRAVALLAVTVRRGGGGAVAKRIMSDTRPLVSRIIRESTDASLLIAAVECLAIVAFVDVDADNMDDTEACLDSIWGLICPAARTTATASPRVFAAAVSAWTLDGRPRRGGGRARRHGGLLYSDCRAVRIAAGEALAVCIEIKLLTRRKNGELLEKFEDRAADLSVEAAGAGVAKDGFLEQKNLFRKIVSFLDGGEPPVSSVRTSASHVLATSTWTDLVRLSFLRRFLAGGFLNHIQGDGLVRQVFTVKGNEIAGKLPAARSKQEVNGGMSTEAKKEKQRGLKKDREASYEVKHGSVTILQ
uniref:Interferon-related developmental regulator N-terminal domain-containing protein n=1 Tax=Leersia perrieri TaxID=77586 RepID=A0A0D9VDU5_9ORYZ